MDLTRTSGATVTFVGLVTVFLALTLLLYVVTALARLLKPKQEPTATAALADADARASTESEPQADVLLLAALAAYGAHRARRVAVRGPQAATAWLRSGRLRQVGRSDALR